MTFLWLCPSLAGLPARPPAAEGFFPMFSLSGFWGVGVSFLFFGAGTRLALALQHHHSTAQHSTRHRQRRLGFLSSTNGRTDGLAWMGMGGAGFLLGTDNGHGARRKTKKRRPQQEGVRFGSFLFSGRAFLFLARSYTLLLPHTPLIGRRTLGSWIPVCGLIQSMAWSAGWTSGLGGR